MDKVGDYKYGLLFSLIMGLLVIGLSFYFIFNELFTQEDIDWQVCRQSIQARATLPDVDLEGFGSMTSFKDAYPLKCKTNVVEIDKGNVKDIDKIIGETMVECWALFDKGDVSAFPDKFFKSSTCVPCARIHLTNEAKDYLKEKNIVVNIRNALDEPMTSEYSYYVYLRDAGKKFSAFDLAGSREWYFDPKGFSVASEEGDFVGAVFHNRLTGAEDDYTISKDVNWGWIGGVSLPEFFDYEKGDLLISYGVATTSNINIGNYIPYLFYFQTGADPNPFEEVSKKLINWPVRDIDMCNEWEGVPA